MTASHAGRYADATPQRGAAPAQAITLVTGIVFLAIGIAGFFITGFDQFFDHHTGEKLLWFEINPAHNVVHLAFGVLGVLLARSWRGAMTFGLVMGIGYAAAFLYGIIALDESWDFLSINAADNWLHLILAALGFAIVAIGAAQRREAHTLA
jgi:hypothetical protein